MQIFPVNWIYKI